MPLSLFSPWGHKVSCVDISLRSYIMFTYFAIASICLLSFAHYLPQKHISPDDEIAYFHHDDTKLFSVSSTELLCHQKKWPILKCARLIGRIIIRVDKVLLCKMRARASLLISRSPHFDAVTRNWPSLLLSVPLLSASGRAAMAQRQADWRRRRRAQPSPVVLSLGRRGRDDASVMAAAAFTSSREYIQITSRLVGPAARRRHAGDITPPRRRTSTASRMRRRVLARAAMRQRSISFAGAEPAFHRGAAFAAPQQAWAGRRVQPARSGFGALHSLLPPAFSSGLSLRAAITRPSPAISAGRYDFSTMCRAKVRPRVGAQAAAPVVVGRHRQSPPTFRMRYFLDMRVGFSRQSAACLAAARAGVGGQAACPATCRGRLAGRAAASGRAGHTAGLPCRHMMVRTSRPAQVRMPTVGAHARRKPYCSARPSMMSFTRCRFSGCGRRVAGSPGVGLPARRRKRRGCRSSHHRRSRCFRAAGWVFKYSIAVRRELTSTSRSRRRRGQATQQRAVAFWQSAAGSRQVFALPAYAPVIVRKEALVRARCASLGRSRSGASSYRIYRRPRSMVDTVKPGRAAVIGYRRSLSTAA